MTLHLPFGAHFVYKLGVHLEGIIRLYELHILGRAKKIKYVGACSHLLKITGNLIPHTQTTTVQLSKQLLEGTKGKGLSFRSPTDPTLLDIKTWIPDSSGSVGPYPSFLSHITLQGILSLLIKMFLFYKSLFSYYTFLSLFIFLFSHQWDSVLILDTKQPKEI
jgi:hypothetical protein